ELVRRRRHIGGRGGAAALGRVHRGGAVGGVRPVGAGGGQPQEHLPCRGLLGGGQAVVDALGAGGDGAVHAAGPVIVGQGDRVPGPVPPGLVQDVRQQRQRPGAERDRKSNTSELQSLTNLVCRLLLEKKNTSRATLRTIA